MKRWQVDGLDADWVFTVHPDDASNSSVKQLERRRRSNHGRCKQEQERLVMELPCLLGAALRSSKVEAARAATTSMDDDEEGSAMESAATSCCVDET